LDGHAAFTDDNRVEIESLAHQIEASELRNDFFVGDVHESKTSDESDASYDSNDGSWSGGSDESGRDEEDLKQKGWKRKVFDRITDGEKTPSKEQKYL
jgi:hypothetical protein